jgi:nitrite reductase/ring-hydroxylating ferredoxin subunit
MKKFLFVLVFLGIIMGCEKDSNRRNNNPYIPNYGFSAILNLNLPAYSGLLSNLNPISVTVEGDIYFLIMKVSDNDYRAWNGNCPNQALTACSRLSISGLNGQCNCEDALIYSLFTGTAQNAAYPMINYRVEVLGNNTIRVFN